MKMGQIIGSSTTRGEEPKSHPVSPNDLRATFFTSESRKIFTSPTRPPPAVHRRWWQADRIAVVARKAQDYNGIRFSFVRPLFAVFLFTFSRERIGQRQDHSSPKFRRFPFAPCPLRRWPAWDQW
jgi:hypothetical protein